MKLSIVILTMGNRPDEVARAIDSHRAAACRWRRADRRRQRRRPAAGAARGDRAAAASQLRRGRRPQRRRQRACTGDVVLFLDDDGWYPEPAALGEHVARRFAADPALAVLSFRVLDPTGGAGGRWYVPRLRAGDPERGSVVTTFAGGACAIRRAAYRRGGRAARPVLLRARGNRPVVAADGARLPDRVRRGRRDVPPAGQATPGTRSGTGSRRGTGSGWPAVTCPGRSPSSTSRTGWR